MDDRLFFWGLFSRGLAFIYCISFFSFIYYNQVVALAGVRGISPITKKLNAIKKDITNPFIRYCRFPTMLWLSSSDTTLTILPIVGFFLAVVTMIGGPYTPLTFGLTWLIYLSLDLPVGLKFPWDSLLLEAGFLAQLLPSTLTITSMTNCNVSATHLPPAGVAFLYRLLLVRLMVGFGRVKFEGHKARDNCYTQGFLISQPMPSIFGWLGSHLPFVLHQIAIGGMFFIEIILPWGLFCTGNVRFIAACGIASLMFGIQLTGNFGYFNMLTIVLCTASMDTTSSIFLWNEWFIQEAPIQSSIALVMVPFLLSLAVLGSLFQSWCNESWVHWPIVLHLHEFSPLLGKLSTFCRIFSPFRIVAAYGVFPPASTPAMRFVTIIEGSHQEKENEKDNTHWKEYGWRFMTSGKGNAASSAPCFIAPHHPRIDHSIFYTAFGINGNNMTMSATTADPYGFNPDSSLCHKIGLRLLQGNCDVMRNAFFSFDPFQGKRPPRQIRASLYVYVPTTIQVWWQSGCTHWWIRKKVGEHMSSFDLLEYEIAQNDRACNPCAPDAFCVDHLPSWYMKKEDPDKNPDKKKDAKILAIFWNQFINKYDEKERFKWGDGSTVGKSAIIETAKEIRVCFDPVVVDGLKRIHSLLRTRLITLFEPFYFHVQIGKDVRRKLLYSAVHNASFSILELVANHIIGQGEHVYKQACEDPKTALLEWGTEKLTIDSGLFLAAILHPKMFVFHGRKWSIFARIGFPKDETPKKIDYSQEAFDKSIKEKEDIDCPVPPEFYVWIVDWINQTYVQKALGVYQDQSLPFVVPPTKGKMWYVDVTKEAKC